MTITRDLTISQVLEMKPEAAQVLTKNGMHCLGCFIASGETVAQAAEAHGINIDTLMEELNAVASA
jgi:hybrid cluster-associated redox disulfide protein